MEWRGRVEICGGRGKKMKGPEDGGVDTGPLLHRLTSSGIQPRVRSTNGGLSSGLSLSLPLPLSHAHNNHIQNAHDMYIYEFMHVLVPRAIQAGTCEYSCTQIHIYSWTAMSNPIRFSCRVKLDPYFLSGPQTVYIFILLQSWTQHIVLLHSNRQNSMYSMVLCIPFSCCFTGKLILYYHSCKCWCVIWETKAKQFSPSIPPCTLKATPLAHHRSLWGKKGLQCHAAEKSQLIPTSVCCALLNLIQLLKPLWQQLLCFKD